MKFKIILISLFLTGIPLFSNAQSMTTPFGGKILETIYCGCTSNFYILFQNVATMMPTSIIYQPGISRLNMNKNVFMSNVNMLGSYSSFGTCEIYVGEGCMELPTSGTITSFPGPGVGTSAF